MSHTTLSEVGQLEALKLQGNYDTGQMFLHKVGIGGGDHGDRGDH